MATQFLWNPGTSNNGLTETAFNLMTTELQGISGSGGIAVSSVGGTNGFFNGSASYSGGALYADIFWFVGNPGIGSAMSAGAALSGWFLTCPDQMTTLAATASWTTSTATLTVASGVSNISAGMPVWDTTNSKFVGIVQSYSSTTLTLNANAANASSGSADSLQIGTMEALNTAPSRGPDFVIPLPATTLTAAAAPFRSAGMVQLPSLAYKVMIQNNCGQTTGNGSTTAPYLKCAPYTPQY